MKLTRKSTGFGAQGSRQAVRTDPASPPNADRPWHVRQDEPGASQGHKGETRVRTRAQCVPAAIPRASLRLIIIRLNRGRERICDQDGSRRPSSVKYGRRRGRARRGVRRWRHPASETSNECKTEYHGIFRRRRRKFMTVQFMSYPYTATLFCQSSILWSI